MPNDWMRPLRYQYIDVPIQRVSVDTNNVEQQPDAAQEEWDILLSGNEESLEASLREVAPQSNEATPARFSRYTLDQMSLYRLRKDSIRAAIQYLDKANDEYRSHAASRLINDATSYYKNYFGNYGFHSREGKEKLSTRMHKFWGKLRNKGTNVVKCQYCNSSHHEDLMLSERYNDTFKVCAYHAADHYATRDYEARRCSMHTNPGDIPLTEGGLMCPSTNPQDATLDGVRWLLAKGEIQTKSTRFFGFEVEFLAKATKDIRKITKTGSPFGVFKSDGSLPGEGAEFCSLPVTLKRAATELRALSDLLMGFECRAWNRHVCGLHIHVSRASASWITWGKVDRFFNSKDNQAFLTRISGREPNDYCRREGHLPPKSTPLTAAKRKAENGGNRYNALNFSTGRKPTVEFRLFRGNVSYNGLMRCMEFCDSIIEFCKTQSNDSDMNHMAYIVWLGSRTRSYPHIRSYLFKDIDNSKLEDAA